MSTKPEALWTATDSFKDKLDLISSGETLVFRFNEDDGDTVEITWTEARTLKIALAEWLGVT